MNQQQELLLTRLRMLRQRGLDLSDFRKLGDLLLETMTYLVENTPEKKA